MSVIQGNAFSDDEVDTGDIGHALRFRGAQHLSRTFGTPTDNRRSTFSVWAKKAVNGSGTSQYLLSANNAPTYTNFGIYSSTDEMGFYNSVSSTNAGNRKTSEVHRDVTGWNHYLMVFDTPNATVEDRMQLWKNGVRITAFSANTAIAQNANPQINAATFHHIGAFAGGEFWNGYLSRICFVDGQALTPSSFGYLNTEINEWVTLSQSAVKAVVDAGGTNSFMLDFDNATSLTTLGYDKSSKGNNWTLNNFSLTAGTTYDHMLDVPGNSYATWSEINKYPSYVFSNAGISFSLTTSAAGVHMANGTIAASSGKWYWEVIPTDVGAGPNLHIGLRETVSRNTIGTNTGFPDGYAYSAGGVKLNNAGSTAYGAAYTNGDVVGVAFDADAGEVTFYKNGATQGVAYTGIPSLSYTPAVGQGNSAASRTTAGNICTGQAPLHASATYHSAAGGYFRYAPPTGFKALCQANLPTPAILNPSSAVVHRFEAGSGIAAAIASDRSSWSDWMEWFKRTDTTESWKVRFSDDSGNMMAFDTNGAKAAWSAPSTGTYLGTAFKVGATYGVVTGTYSGDSTSNKNISHSLGKAPKCGIVKNESTGTWYVWHTKMTSAAYFTTLNSATPPAQSNTNTPWGTGNWSSTQFMVTNNATNNLNATGSTYRYILFADIDGLLALLGHTGNASTDGAFESSGHKAQLLIEKDLSATTGFYLWSDKIDTYNVTASYLLLNTNAGTAAATGVDICSNGTKYRSATIANAANPHMGISYSRTPGKYSLGR